MKNFFKTSLLIILTFTLTYSYSNTLNELSSPEKVIEIFFKMKKENINSAELIFTDDYKKFFSKYEDEDHEKDYKVIKVFQSNNGPKNLYISLVKIKSDGSLYYTFYFLKNKSVYKINDLDRFWIPNPADFPGIEEQIISTLTKNHKAYKIKK